MTTSEIQDCIIQKVIHVDVQLLEFLNCISRANIPFSTSEVLLVK